MASENHAGLLTSEEGRGQAVLSPGSLENRSFPCPGAAGLRFLRNLDAAETKALQGGGLVP